MTRLQCTPLLPEPVVSSSGLSFLIISSYATYPFLECLRLQPSPRRSPAQASGSAKQKPGKKTAAQGKRLEGGAGAAGGRDEDGANCDKEEEEDGDPEPRDPLHVGDGVLVNADKDKSPDQEFLAIIEAIYEVGLGRLWGII